MSNFILTMAYKSSVATPVAISVLVALADQANDDGLCWPSVESLMQRTRCSRRTVQRTLVDLEQDGHITRHFKANYSTHYLVTPKILKNIEGVDEVGEKMVEVGGVTVTPGGVTVTPLGASHRRPNHNRTLNEPKENRKVASTSLFSDDSFEKIKKGARRCGATWKGDNYVISEGLEKLWNDHFPKFDWQACIFAATVWRLDEKNGKKIPKANVERHLTTWIQRDFERKKNKGGWVELGVVEAAVPELAADGPAGWDGAFMRLYDTECLHEWGQLSHGMQREILAEMRAVA